MRKTLEALKKQHNELCSISSTFAVVHTMTFVSTVNPPLSNALLFFVITYVCEFHHSYSSNLALQRAAKIFSIVLKPIFIKFHIRIQLSFGVRSW